MDLNWFREHFVNEILPQWYETAPQPNGAFLPAMDRAWRPTGERICTAVSQARLVYVFAEGYRMTAEERYREAAVRGARFLAEQMRDNSEGGWFNSTDDQGAPVDTDKCSYHHAFVVFGFAHAWSVEPDETFLDCAEQARTLLKTRFRDAHGGMIHQMSQEFADRDRSRTQNPMMHSFEALLTLYEQCGISEALNDATEIAEFLFGRCYDTDRGYLPETYDTAWRPLPGSAGGRIDLGHQFEWTFLLSRAEQLGMSPELLEYAQALLRFGRQMAVDSGDGGIFPNGTPEGGVPPAAKSYWCQAEYLRALLHTCHTRTMSELVPEIAGALDFVQRRFLDPDYGGWYTTVRPDGTVENAAKGSVWKLDYHITAMCAEAVRLADCGNG